MEGVERVSPRDAHEKVKAGKALLVCAYESDARFAQYHLAEAISFNDFKTRFPSLPYDHEVIFYCN